MKNRLLAEKIRKLRFDKRLSQEELAERSKLSLRTIQRIENGETEPRGDTLRRIAQGLEANTGDIIEQTEAEDSAFLAFFNLSALSFFVFPILGIIVPSAIWVLKKEKIKYLNETGKHLLNFQISWCMVLGLIYLLVSASAITHIGAFKVHENMISIIAMLAGLYIVNTILIILNTIRSYRAKRVFYQPAIPFLR